MEVLAVMVRYKTPLTDSPTVRSLEQAFAVQPDLLRSIGVMIWDNSPEPLEDASLPFPVSYRHASSNMGMSGAFNSAAAIAYGEGTPWMLMLDQDTTLPEHFLSQMLQHAVDLKDTKEVAAIVPKVYVRDFVVSPRRMMFNRHKAYPDGPGRILDGEPAAINSGSLLRVRNLIEIGGYSEAFWLDYSDWYVFHQLFLHRKQVWWASEIRLDHSMTVMDYDNLMTPGRYRNFIAAEGAYNDLFKGQLENAVQTLRLLARAARQRRRFKNPEFSRITLRYFWKRLFAGRKRRLQSWQEVNAGRSKNLHQPV